MDVLIYIFIFVGFCFVAYRAFRKEKEPSISVEAKANKHGHRCYVEGLSLAEKHVVDVLAHGLNYKEYFIFNNLILPSENNGSTQIDHVVVSKYGIFVIESKDFNGWIFGDQNSSNWTQSLPGANKFKFQNPLHQNWAHIMALRSLLPLTESNFYSLVVFSNKCEFKTPRVGNVYYLSELIEAIKGVTVERISEAALYQVIGKLSYLCQAIDTTAAEHISNVRASMAARVK